MSATEWLVVAGGVAAIAWVNWYFFVAGRARTTTAALRGGVQEVRVGVHGGYDPARITVKRGAPVRLVFDRQETSSCSEEVVFPDFGIRKFLPAFAQTAVELTPTEAGDYEFTCGMGMLRGRLIVEA
jgi:plastocyanin domain-containing protein